MKKLKKLNLNNASLMNEAEMKMVTGGYSGGFDCGNGKTYYTGTCNNGVGFSICAYSYNEAYAEGQAFCRSYN